MAPTGLYSIFVISSLSVGVFAGPMTCLGQSLQVRLDAENVGALARAAHKEGDPQRGAVLFHQPFLGCSKCHASASRGQTLAPLGLGPNLAESLRNATMEELVESVLAPSKVIKKGYETITAELANGRVATGLLVKESEEQLVLRDPTTGSPIALDKTEVELQRIDPASIMPSGLLNQLSSRQQFLDLVRYLIEIRDGGPERARQLQPPPSLLALVIPEYEEHVDHAGMIRDLDMEAFERGQAIYQRLCVNCHGTHDRPGSLPTSLRFASGKFKNGSDPFAMYGTLTRGFGLMTPQSWMVPQQKYDVIHYIREAYLNSHNLSQYIPATEEYLSGLPQGDTRGPAPSTIEPWSAMDYGPSLTNTYEIGSDGANFAHKGIAVRLDAGAGGVSRGRAWTVFDHDTLRMAGAWTGAGFIDWNGIHFNGRHQVHPRVVGDVLLDNPTGPGWANPETGSFSDDVRVLGRDGRRYGPLPREWARFRGLYHHGDQVVLSYTVGQTEVLESPGVIFLPFRRAASEKATTATRQNLAEWPVFTRTFNFGPRNKDLVLLAAGRDSTIAGLVEPVEGCSWTTSDGRLCLRIPAGAAPLRMTMWMTRQTEDVTIESVKDAVSRLDPAPDLKTLTHGGPSRWPETLTTEPVRGADEGPFAVDVLTHPESNPWLAQMRFTGLDFYPDGDRAVVCAWDGDVWLVAGLASLDAAKGNPSSGPPQLSWRRIASGLFQPLGIKIIQDQIAVTCRDQLAILRDKNADGETDFYESFNNDHQVTEHFHEFAMGLQTDDQGNFYYAKSARHALPAVVPHHGTLLRVSADGAETEILATGFRAANGVCLNPDGSFVVSDQEGHWTPKNRINWVVPGGFYGNMFGYHDVTDSSDDAMKPPLCWITNEFDRSPAELLWAPPDAWGPLGGSLLNLSYGNGKIFVVPLEDVAGQKQGGMCALPIPLLPTGVMRGRFHPRDRQLYACGMFAWAGNATQAGGLYRIRYTGKPMYLPTALRAHRDRIEVAYSDPLDRAFAADPSHYSIKSWSLRRTADYGSEHYDEKSLSVARVNVSADGRTIALHIPELRPTWGMEIVCHLEGLEGERCERVIHNSIFRIND